MTTDTTTQAVERKYLIRKYGAYYRPNSRGYTGSAIQAGRYTLQEAEYLTHPNGKDGPRDSMSYIHEDGIACPDWQAYSALLAERDALAAALAAAQAAQLAAEAKLATARADALEEAARRLHDMIRDPQYAGGGCEPIIDAIRALAKGA